MTRERILVFGARGHAKVVIDVLERQGKYGVTYLVDDDPAMKGLEVFGYPVLGGKHDLFGTTGPRHVEFGIVAIGANAARQRVARWLVESGFSLVSAVHPSAVLGRGCTLGEGSVVMAGVVINPDALLGSNCIINTGARVDHDCHIGDGVHLAPGSTLCGTVQVGDETLIGAGATVAPNLTIGANVTVGAGATVLSDIPDGITVVGTPARACGQTGK